MTTMQKCGTVLVFALVAGCGVPGEEIDGMYRLISSNETQADTSYAIPAGAEMVEVVAWPGAGGTYDLRDGTTSAGALIFQGGLEAARWQGHADLFASDNIYVTATGSPWSITVNFYRWEHG